ncbi:MAG: DMT family transporter [Bacteroidota bacterium]
MNPQSWKAHLALFGVSSIYGVNYFIAKFVFTEVSPFGVVAIRSIGSVIGFWLIARWWIREPISDRKDYLLLCISGLCGASLNQIFFFWGLSKTQAVNASVLMTLTPIFVFLTAYLLRTEKMTYLKVMGLLFSFAGAALISLGGRKLSIDHTTIIGDGMILFNAAVYGIFLVIVRPLMLKYHFITVMKWALLFGACINIPLGIPDLMIVDWPGLSTQAIWGIVFIVLLVTMGAYSLNSWALQQLPSSAVGIYIYLQPVIVACLAFFLNRGGMTGDKLGYMLLVFVGVYLVTYRKKN